MLFREHRGSLDDSMKTVETIHNSREAVAAYARVLLYEERLISHEEIKREMTADRISCQHLTWDQRIGWDTYLLTSDWARMPIIGYCNGPLEDCKEQ